MLEGKKMLKRACKIKCYKGRCVCATDVQHGVKTRGDSRQAYALTRFAAFPSSRISNGFRIPAGTVGVALA